MDNYDKLALNKKRGTGGQARLVFLDQISRFVFGFAAMVLGLLLLSGEIQAKFLLAASVISFAALIVRWGADHTFYFRVIGADRVTARGLALNGFLVSTGVAAVVGLGVLAYFLTYPGMLMLGLPALALLAFSTTQQAAAPLEVYLRVHGNLRRAMIWRICLQTIALVAKAATLIWWDVTEFAAVSALEALGMIAVYLLVFEGRAEDGKNIRRSIILDQLRTGSMWGMVAVSTMVMSVLIISAVEQALPLESAAVFLFSFRMFGATNNIVGAAAIALSHKLMRIQYPRRYIDIVSTGAIAISVSALILLFLLISAEVARPNLGGASIDWALALGGMASLVPISTGAALNGRILATVFGAKASLLSLIAAVGMVALVGARVAAMGMWGAVLLVFFAFATILFTGPLIIRFARPSPPS